MRSFKYKKGPAFLDGWRVSDEGDCGTYALTAAYDTAGGALVMILDILFGHTVFWLVFSDKRYPSHVAIWHKGLGWSCSTIKGWRKKFEYFGPQDIALSHQTLAWPITLGPIPICLLALALYLHLPITATLAAVWVGWVPFRVLQGFMWKAVTK